MADFIPKPDPELIDWLNNFKTKLDDYGVTLGMTTLQVSNQQSAIDGYIALHTETENLKDTLQAKVQERTTAKAALLVALRKLIGKFKEQDPYTAAMGEDMDIVSETPAFDPSTFKTTLKAQQEGSGVVIKFTKSQTEGVNLYARLRGEPGWTFLARDTFSPYVDNRPLATAGTAETREYKARGVIDDAEIGLDSDIVSVVFSG